MTIVVPDISDQLMLKFILNKQTVDGSSPAVPNGERKLKLFSNNLTPSKATILGDIIESNAPGYSDYLLSGSNWTVSNVDGVNYAEYPAITFTITDGANVYGYYVTNYSATELLWIERFPAAPFELPPGGGEITVTLKITLN